MWAWHEVPALVSLQKFTLNPAEVRARFGNDPAAFMSFVEDDANRDEARRLGLLRDPDPVPDPVRVQVVPDAGTPASGAAAG